MMFQYKCLNPISPCGTSLFTEEYKQVEELQKADAVLVRSAAMHDMQDVPNLLAVARAGAGVNNIPIADYSEKGIVVFNTPGANANGVKEMVIAGMLLASRDLIGGNKWVEENKEDPNITKAMEKAKKALEKNNMQVFIADNKNEVLNIVKTLIKKGDIIGSGGSVSLTQCGIIDLLRTPDYNFLDRANFTPENIKEFYIKCFSTDAYFTSANAITENGELYNVDGNSNRIAAIAYGPESVIVVAGYNKIVKNLDEAINRVKSTAAPANTVRLNCKTYCNETGECAAFGQSCPGMTSGCSSSDRICCNFLVSAQQRHKNRIKVILVAEPLGY